MFKSTFSRSKVLCSGFVFLVIALCGSHNLYASVANGPMRGLTNHQIIDSMFLGWNLGNTMDANTETGWGNPVTTQAMIDVLAKGGFKTLREPVTWQNHFGAAPTYTIDSTWLDRVVAIANYALNDSMYVIVNTHHEGWDNLGATGTAMETIKAECAALWTQIANAFKNYGDYVIFEIFNEPNTGATNSYSGGTAANRAVLDTYQVAAVNAIRATGGNNATRKIVLQGISASPIAVSVATIPIVDTNCIVSLHTYDPTGFSLNCNPTTWGSTADSASIRNDLKSQDSMLIKKGGVAVLGEWGSQNCDQLTPSRVAHAFYYAQQTRDHAMVPVWWDDGAGYEILNRTGLAWEYPTIAAALLAGAKSATFGSTFPTATISEPPKDEGAPFGLQERAGIINYTLPKTAFVSLCVYTIQGRMVSTLVKSKQLAGNYEVKLSTKDISFGHYILEFKAGNYVVMKGFNIFK